MMPEGRRERLVVVGRVLLGALFIYAAIQKLAAPDSFAESIEGYRMVPREWAGWLALLVPSTELVVGVSLIIGLGSRAAGFVAGVMLVGFSVAIGQALMRGINIDCGCFGSNATDADYLALVRNAALTAIAAFVAFSREVRWRTKKADG